MTELRRKLEDARTEYRTAKYDGDLAADVLGETERRANPWTAARLRWFMPALVGAMAAMLAVVLWQRHWNASSTPTPKMVNTHPKPEPKAHITLVLDRFPDVEPIVQDVRSSMKQAVDELATGMDRAKPLIRGGVESVRGAADEIKEQATETWKQMRKPKSGTLLDPRQLPAQLTVAVA